MEKSKGVHKGKFLLPKLVTNRGIWETPYRIHFRHILTYSASRTSSTAQVME